MYQSLSLRCGSKIRGVDVKIVCATPRYTHTSNTNSQGFLDRLKEVFIRASDLSFDSVHLKYLMERSGCPFRESKERGVARKYDTHLVRRRRPTKGNILKGAPTSAEPPQRSTLRPYQRRTLPGAILQLRLTTVSCRPESR